MTEGLQTQTWFTITEAAEYTRKSVEILRRAVRGNELRHSRSGRGGKLYFKRQWLDTYMGDIDATNADTQPSGFRAIADRTAS